MDVPRGTITPPCTELNLYNTLFSTVKSNSLVKDNPNVVVARVSAPAGETDNALLVSVGSTLRAYPGLLSIACSPGYINIVVLSVTSLSIPD